MAAQTQQEGFSEFLKTFKDIARHKHRYDVFRDFVTMAACSLHNSLAKDEKREAEYVQIIGSYEKKDQQAFPKLLSILVALLENEPRDILGPLYMQLEISSKDQGQFFTPPELSELMAAMTYGPDLAKLEKDFITLSEPACGAEGMVLSFVKILISHKHNPAEKLWVQCIDVDRMSALMCYIQLSLWNVPAEILVGDTLRWDIREIWHTPAHHMGFWEQRLKRADDASKISEADVSLEPPDPEPAKIEGDIADYQTSLLEWKGQTLTVRWCPEWTPGTIAHLEIVTGDKKAHPISETGYRSHFVQKQQVEEMGGPVAYVTAWLEELDDGKPVQLSLF